MECKFYVGQKVVIRNGDFQFRAPFGEELPKHGVVYTIREFTLSGNDVCLRLVKIRNPPNHYREGFREGVFEASCFRPAVETKTDISVLRKIVEDAMAGKVREKVKESVR